MFTVWVCQYTLYKLHEMNFSHTNVDDNIRPDKRRDKIKNKSRWLPKTWICDEILTKLHSHSNVVMYGSITVSATEYQMAVIGYFWRTNNVRFSLFLLESHMFDMSQQIRFEWFLIPLPECFHPFIHSWPGPEKICNSYEIFIYLFFFLSFWVDWMQLLGMLGEAFVETDALRGEYLWYHSGNTIWSMETISQWWYFALK